MRRIAVIDAETDPFRKGRVPQPFIWGFYDGSQYREFNTTEELIEFLKVQDCICYAHNGGKFDFHYILPGLEGYDSITIINGRIAQCWIGVCELRDSWLIINEPLSKYKKDEIDYAIFERDERVKEKNMRKIRAYLKSDCVYLWELVSAFVARFGPQLTQAGAAMKKWQTICEIPEERTDEEFYAEMVPYYYGGRVECFRSGIIDTRFSVYDINSAYPYAMLAKHPYSANYERIAGLADNADFVHLRCIARGCFPYRGMDDVDDDTSGGLSFPRDNIQREYYVTGWEYRAAIDTDCLADVEIIESLRFVRHTDFSAYILPLWKERAEAKAKGDILTGLFTKLLMNSLYGKWAANPENYRNYIIVPPEETEWILDGSGEWDFGGELGPWALAQKPLSDMEKRYYNVATGASITGYVRAYLWRAIHSSKGVLYCDTDSIAVQKKGTKLRLGDMLGAWKNEGTFDKAGISGKKLYIFRGAPNWWTDKTGKTVQAAKKPEGGKRLYKKASKGVRLTNAELWRVAAGGSVDYKAEVPTYSIKNSPGMVTQALTKEEQVRFFTNRTIVKTV